jgi:multicomponent Na+:H+ antiporter subunit F
MIPELPLYILGLAIILALARLIRGPNLPSRVVAFDLMTTIGMGLIAVYAVLTDRPIYLDVAVVMALVSFLGTIAFAYYLERRGR